MTEPHTQVPLDDIRAASRRIRGAALRTPLVRLNADAPAELYLKLENLQPVGSFKLRGAANAVRQCFPGAACRRRLDGQRGQHGAGARPGSPGTRACRARP